MTHRYQTTRAAELESLAAFRETIDQACRQHPRVDAQTVYDLKLAVDEACTNIITHGYAGMNPGSIILAIDVQPDRLVTTITDFGHPFEPGPAPAPDVQAGLDNKPMGSGFGLFFIYQTMDEIGYLTTEDGNRLTFVKRLAAPSAT